MAKKRVRVLVLTDANRVIDVIKVKKELTSDELKYARQIAENLKLRIIEADISRAKDVSEVISIIANGW